MTPPSTIGSPYCASVIRYVGGMRCAPPLDHVRHAIGKADHPHLRRPQRRRARHNDQAPGDRNEMELQGCGLGASSAGARFGPGRRTRF
jgi:hypothetical protein